MKLYKHGLLGLTSLIVASYSPMLFASGYEWSGASFHNPATIVSVNEVDFRGYGNRVTTYNSFQGIVTSGGFVVGNGRAISDPTWNYLSFDSMYRINPQWVFGLNLNKPYGSALDYPVNSVIAPAGTKTVLDSLQLTPSVAYQANPQLSLGAGIDILTMRGELGAVPFFPFITSEFQTNFNPAWTAGVHGGFMYRLATEGWLRGTFIDGVYYAPKSLTAYGNSTLGNAILSGSVNATLILPDKYRMNITQFLSEKFFMYVTVDYTHWGKIQQLIINNNLGPGVDTHIPLGYRNTWAFIGGAHWAPSEKVFFDGGGGYDPKSVNTNRVSDNAALPAGTNGVNAWAQGTYMFAKPFGVNFGYSHFFKQEVDTTGSTTPAVPAAVGLNGKTANSYWLGLFYIV